MKKMFIQKQYADGVTGVTVEPGSDELLNEARKRIMNTAVITICHFSGEGWDENVKQHRWIRS